jgi:hypothetical protein
MGVTPASLLTRRSYLSLQVSNTTQSCHFLNLHNILVFQLTENNTKLDRITSHTNRKPKQKHQTQCRA